MLPLDAVSVDWVIEDIVGELGPAEGVAGAEGGGDPAEVGGGEGAQHSALVLAEIDAEVAGWSWVVGLFRVRVRVEGGGDAREGEGGVEVEESHGLLVIFFELGSDFNATPL